MAGELENMIAKILQPGDSIEHRVSDTKFVDGPESDNINKKWRGISMFPDKNAHEHIDTLINRNEIKQEVNRNRDYFELTDSQVKTGIEGLSHLTPPGIMQNVGKIGEFLTEDVTLPDLQQLIQYISQGGEQDPVGPQGLPFSEYMEGRQDLLKIQDIIRNIGVMGGMKVSDVPQDTNNQEILSILNEYVNGKLFNKKRKRTKESLGQTFETRVPAKSPRY